ncbi:GntR family transcriptional regulator [Rhizobium sp. 18055]|uniref:GntR family transcriptional regulator n=1 Tax=Rhizobium sp. 18055 TaxID=2681403 RepID=UPI00135A4740|nr:GntR family transcriptional regulator [Rhizobium sp. 18055]
MHSPSRLSPSATATYERLKEEIVFGIRHPRERLIESELVERLQTNRAALREALSRLELDGLVQRTLNRGAAVRDLTPVEVEKIYDVRIELETLAVDRIPFPLNDDALEHLTAIQQTHTEAVQALDQRKIFVTNNEFHREMYRLCGNEHLVEMIDIMANRALLVRFHPYQQREFLSGVCDEHWRMIDALKKHDRNALIDLVKIHLPRAKDGYLSSYAARTALEVG